MGCSVVICPGRIAGRDVLAPRLQSLTGPGFWNSWNAHRIRWRVRYLRTRRLELAGEPVRHRSNQDKRAREPDFRQGVNQLRPFSHPVMRGPVALDLDFHVAATQPPAIYHLAKRYLDVLGAAAAGVSVDGRRHLLYRDDRQVRLWQPIADDVDADRGCTLIVARPLRDVLADLELADALRDRVDPFDDEEASPFFMPRVPDIESESVFDLSLAADAAQARLWEDLNTWSRLYDQSQVQLALLARTDALIASMLTRSRRLIAAGRARSNVEGSGLQAPFEAPAADDRELLLSSPLHISLPSLPAAHGQHSEFQDSFREQLVQ